MILGLLAACQPGSTSMDPPDIRYGVESCAHCSMIISDPRFAASFVIEVADGRYESLIFDDIGDMLDHAAAHPEYQVVAWYVNDYSTQTWMDATEAHYTLSHGIRSPMAAGLAAHLHRHQAVEMASAHDGTALTWLELQHVARSDTGLDVSHAHP